MKASIDQIHQLVEACLGENYISKSKLRRIFMRRFYLATVYNGRALIGVAWFKYISGREFTTKSKGSIKLSAETLILDVMAVHPKYQKRGVGKQLMEKLLKSAKDESWYCFAWKSKDGVHMASLLKRIGAKPIWKNDLHYFKESIKSVYKCPICGNPCKCGVVLYKHRLTGDFSNEQV
jgi:GNAT superfamily N-acetyltransferase